MLLSDQVCTLDQAKRLKELGVKQESYFSWCGDETPRLMDNCAAGIEYGPWVFINTTHPINNMESDHREDVPSAKPFASAFTVAELGEMMPPGWHTMKVTHGASFKWRGYDLDGYDVAISDNEANTRAAMLIHLLENNLIKL